MGRLRRARPDDLDVLLDLAAEYCAHDRHDFDKAVARDGIMPLLADDRWGVIWLIIDHATDQPTQAPLGYVAVTWGWSIEVGGVDVVLDEFYVRDRGHGLGTAAHAEVVGELQRRGVRRITLETEAHNEPARRLYRRLGYETEASTWMTLTL